MSNSMRSRLRELRYFTAILGSLLALACTQPEADSRATARPSDPLASWQDTAPKRAILDFVQTVTESGGADFVLPEERVAVFDNDGTLWVEKPIYTQLTFAFDQVKRMAPQHPEWQTTEPFKSLIDGDMESVVASGEKGILEIVMATHAGMTTDKFETIVGDWLRTAKHPRFERPYTELVYQPMLELLEYLRANGFKMFIVSGGGVEFMRPWTEAVYGIPPEQVVGSTIETKYEIRDGRPVLMRLPEIDFVDDKAGKPVGINKFIGRRPILAFGNSDGDYEMLQWVTAGKGKRMGLILHHTDAEREYAYDRESHVGTLRKGLDDAAQNGWTVVDMKTDWKQVLATTQ